MFESMAYAADQTQTSAPNPLVNFFPFVIIFVIFYFLMLRPQQKKQQELNKMIAGLKKGDTVVTIGGIIGVVTSLQDDYVVIKVGENENTKMEVLKTAISGLRK